MGGSVSKRFGRNFEAFVTAENVLAAAYVVGRAGVDTAGSPRMIRIGIRVRLSGSESAY